MSFSRVVKVDKRFFDCLKGLGTFQGLLHPFPAYACGSFRRGGSVPMSLKTDRIVKSSLLERAKLGRPIDKSFVDGRPLHFALCILDCILAVTVVDTVLRQSL